MQSNYANIFKNFSYGDPTSRSSGVRMCRLMRQSVGEGGRWMRGGYYFNKNYRGLGKCIGILWSGF